MKKGVPDELRGEVESKANKKVDKSSKGNDKATPATLMPSPMSEPKKTTKKKRKKKEKMDPSCMISSPSNFRQPVHVDFNSETGFSGLPPEWETLIKGNISKDECIANSNAVLQVIEFHQRGMVPVGPARSDTPDFTNLGNEKDEEPEDEEEDGGENGGDGKVSVRKDKVRKRHKGDELGNLNFRFFFIFCYFLTSCVFLDWIDEGDPTELFIELEKCGEGFAKRQLLNVEKNSFFVFFLDLLEKFTKEYIRILKKLCVIFVLFLTKILTFLFFFVLDCH